MVVVVLLYWLNLFKVLETLFANGFFKDIMEKKDEEWKSKKKVNMCLKSYMELSFRRFCIVPHNMTSK